LLNSVTLQDDEQSLLLDWSTSEIELLFTNIEAWWADWEKYVSETFEHPRQFHTERLERITQKIVQILQRFTVLLDPTEAGPVREFSQLIQTRMNDWGFIVTPDSQEDRKAAAEGVILHLLSNSDRLVEQAIWDAAQLIRDEDNQILRQLMISRIIDRASPSLDVALRAVTYLMKMQIQMFHGNDLQLTLTSLDYLSEETQLKPENMTVLRQEARTARSDVRAAASEFIESLIRYANTINPSDTYIQDHPTVQKWRAIGQSDPLPEVRQPWEKSGQE
uniref:hypothetical protein n=1 Tax=Deinococcus saxicola TaxID=249406 RepID=UPI003D0CDBBA